MEKNHVVVTIYIGPKRTVVHTYGPYTWQKATAEKRRLTKVAVREWPPDSVRIAVCKMIDIDRMNAELEVANGADPENQGDAGASRS